MGQQRGRYTSKVYEDGDDDDVCVLYDFVTPKVTFFCSWYQVKDGKITSIQRIRASAVTEVSFRYYAASCPKIALASAPGSSASVIGRPTTI